MPTKSWYQKGRSFEKILKLYQNNHLRILHASKIWEGGLAIKVVKIQDPQNPQKGDIFMDYGFLQSDSRENIHEVEKWK